MVDIQIGKGMSDAQKIACEIVSQMPDKEGTRIKNLLTGQWGNQRIAIGDIPNTRLSWERAVEPDNGKAIDLTNLVGSQLDTLVRFENQCRGPVYFVQQKVFLIQVVKFPIIDRLGIDRTPIINGIQAIKLGLKENEDAPWSIVRASVPTKKEPYTKHSPITERMEAYRALQQRLIRPGLPREIHDNILQGLVASDPRRRLCDLYAWCQWKDEKMPLTFTQYETIRCFEFGREHDKMTDGIRTDNLQYFRQSHLIFVKSGDQWQVIDAQGQLQDVPLAKIRTKATIQKEWRVYEEQKEQKRQQEELNESKKRKREETKAARAAKKPASTPAKADQAELDEANGPAAELRGALTELRRVHQSLEEKKTLLSRELETANSELDRVKNEYRDKVADMAAQKEELDRVKKEYRDKVADMAAQKEELDRVKRDYRDKVADVAVQKEELIRQRQQQDATFHRTKADMEQKERSLTLALNANDELNKKLEAYKTSNLAMPVPGSTVDREHIAAQEHEIATLKTENQILTLEYNTLEDEKRALEVRMKDLISENSSMELYMEHNADQLRKFADDMMDRVNGMGRFQDLDDQDVLDKVENLETLVNGDGGDMDVQADHPVNGDGVEDSEIAVNDGDMGGQADQAKRSWTRMYS
ncbi:hypothetical protein LQW54_005715 [Pestalotiopsis sp. IQ-011]